MAALLALARVRREVFSGDLPIADTVDQLCRDAGLLWRNRLLTPLITLRLFVLHILHGNTSIAHLRQLCGLDFAQSSYCQARQRLPLEVIRGLLATMFQWVERTANATVLLGQRVFICDASSHSMSDTPELRERFGLPTSTKPGVGYPVAKLMGLMDAATGLFTALLAVPLFTHDMRHVLQLEIGRIAHTPTWRCCNCTAPSGAFVYISAASVGSVASDGIVRRRIRHG